MRPRLRSAALMREARLVAFGMENVERRVLPHNAGETPASAIEQSITDPRELKKYRSIPRDGRWHSWERVTNGVCGASYAIGRDGYMHGWNSGTEYVYRDQYWWTVQHHPQHGPFLRVIKRDGREYARFPGQGEQMYDGRKWVRVEQRKESGEEEKKRKEQQERAKKEKEDQDRKFREEAERKRKEMERKNREESGRKENEERERRENADRIRPLEKILSEKLAWIRTQAARSDYMSPDDVQKLLRTCAEYLDAPGESGKTETMGINRCLEGIRIINPVYRFQMVPMILAFSKSHHIRLNASGKLVLEKIAMAKADHQDHALWQRLDVSLNDSGVNYINSDMQRLLEKLNGQTGTVPEGTCTLRKLEISPGIEFDFAFDVVRNGKAETWCIGQLLPGPEYDNGIVHYGGRFCLVKTDHTGKSDYLTQTSVLRSQVFSFREHQPDGGTLAPGWERAVLRACDRAEQERESEQADATNMASFDLPKRFGYLPLHQEDRNDRAMHGEMQRMEDFHRIMSLNGRDVVLVRGAEVDKEGRATKFRIMVGENPQQGIRQYIQDLVSQGVDHIYIPIAAHGYDTLAFKLTGGGTSYLSYRTLMEIFRQFPTVRFTVNALACHGAWNTNHMDYKAILRDVEGAPEGRVTIITQTKPYRLNWGNTFDRYLQFYLLHGFPFGLAYQEADRQTKIRTGLNPEVHRSSPGNPTYSARGEESQSRDQAA